MVAKVKRIAHRLWNSPTYTTWLSFLSRPLYLLLLTPLVVTKLSVEEVAVWFLFTVYLGLQSLGDFGFNSTVIRAYAYALGGAKQIKVFKDIKVVNSNSGPNWNLIEEIDSTIHYIFIILSLIYSIILLSIGTLTLRIPIAKVENPLEVWSAWVIIIIVSAFNLYGNRYSAYINGLNKVALFMRWQTLFSIVSILTSALVLNLTSNLLILVIVYEFWIFISVVRNYFISRSVYDKKFKYFKDRGINKEVYAGIFPSAWRTWLAQFMSYGLIQISGIYYAQIGSTQSTATYLFSLKIIDQIKQFSNAPFYSRIPSMAKLFAENNLKQVIKNAQKGMLLSHLTFTLTFSIIGAFMPFFLKIIGSNVNFADKYLWLSLGLAYWLERYGAMHFQMYGLTNHIVAHIGNGITGIIYLIFCLLLVKSLGVIGFPVSYIIGCLLFYTWFGAWHSYRYFNLNFIKYEFDTTFPALLLWLGYFIYIYIN